MSTKRNALVFLLSAVSIIILTASCSKKEVIKPSEENIRATKAEAALREMERAYTARNLKGVMELVAPELKSGFSEFETGVRKDMETYVQVRLDITVERVEESGDRARVALNWYGVWVDKDGKETEGRGNAVFSFRDSDPMKLVEFVGDSPFGVMR